MHTDLRYVRWAMVLLVSFAGCAEEKIDGYTVCLSQTNFSPKCCPADYHIDKRTCCPDGTHAVFDVQHPSWEVCILDEDPSDAGQDAGSDAW